MMGSRKERRIYDGRIKKDMRDRGTLTFLVSSKKVSLEDRVPEDKCKTK